MTAKSRIAAKLGLKSTKAAKSGKAFIDDRGDVGVQVEGLKACREYLDECIRERLESLILNDYPSYVELQRRKAQCN
jgi:hypothetical protein